MNSFFSSLSKEAASEMNFSLICQYLFHNSFNWIKCFFFLKNPLSKAPRFQISINKEIFQKLKWKVQHRTFKVWKRWHSNRTLSLFKRWKGPRIVKTLNRIFKKSKISLHRKQKISVRKFFKEARYFCATSVRRILKIDLKLKHYKNGNRTMMIKRSNGNRFRKKTP